MTSPSLGREPWLPILDDRSPDPRICPFLRAIDAEDELGPPGRLARSGQPLRCPARAGPQSLRQQELVCLTAGHINCPRYLRGAVSATDAAEAAVVAGRSFRPPTLPVGRPSISPAILAALVMVVVAFAASVSFVVARGGLELTPTVGEGPSASVVAGDRQSELVASRHRGTERRRCERDGRTGGDPRPDSHADFGADRHAGTDSESDSRADPGAHA